MLGALIILPLELASLKRGGYLWNAKTISLLFVTRDFRSKRTAAFFAKCEQYILWAVLAATSFARSKKILELSKIAIDFDTVKAYEVISETNTDYLES